MELIEMGKNFQKTIDSNVLIGVFLPGDRLEEKATEILKKINTSEKRLFVHPLVLIEVLSILKYKGGLELAIKSKKIILSNFESEEKLGSITKRAGRIFEKYRKIGMVDAILLDYCLDNKVELVTLDKEMEKIWEKLKRRN